MSDDLICPICNEYVIKHPIVQLVEDTAFGCATVLDDKIRKGKLLEWIEKNADTSLECMGD